MFAQHRVMIPYASWHPSAAAQVSRLWLRQETPHLIFLFINNHLHHLLTLPSCAWTIQCCRLCQSMLFLWVTLRARAERVKDNNSCSINPCLHSVIHSKFNKPDSQLQQWRWNRDEQQVEIIKAWSKGINAMTLPETACRTQGWPKNKIKQEHVFRLIKRD